MPYELFQFGFSKENPHFVVANDYAHAEELINHAGYAVPDKLVRASKHVLTPETLVAHQPDPIIPEEELPEINPINEMTEDSSYMKEEM